MKGFCKKINWRQNDMVWPQMELHSYKIYDNIYV